jgi:hypothetical protein
VGYIDPCKRISRPKDHIAPEDKYCPKYYVSGAKMTPPQVDVAEITASSRSIATGA